MIVSLRDDLNSFSVLRSSAQGWRNVMANNVSVEKSFEFSVRIVKLYQYLTKNQKEFVDVSD